MESYRSCWNFGASCSSARKWWLAPILILLLTLGLVLVVAEGSALAPFIYSLLSLPADASLAGSLATAPGTPLSFLRLEIEPASVQSTRAR
jgi:uncharacterized membrane protein YjdF